MKVFSDIKGRKYRELARIKVAANIESSPIYQASLAGEKLIGALEIYDSVPGLGCLG